MDSGRTWSAHKTAHILSSGLRDQKPTPALKGEILPVTSFGNLILEVWPTQSTLSYLPNHWVHGKAKKCPLARTATAPQSDRGGSHVQQQDWFSLSGSGQAGNLGTQTSKQRGALLVSSLCPAVTTIIRSQRKFLKCPSSIKTGLARKLENSGASSFHTYLGDWHSGRLKITSEV